MQGENSTQTSKIGIIGIPVQRSGKVFAYNAGKTDGLVETDNPAPVNSSFYDEFTLTTGVSALLSNESSHHPDIMAAKTNSSFSKDGEVDVLPREDFPSVLGDEQKQSIETQSDLEDDGNLVRKDIALTRDVGVVDETHKPFITDSENGQPQRQSSPLLMESVVTSAMPVLTKGPIDNPPTVSAKSQKTDDTLKGYEFPSFSEQETMNVRTANGRHKLELGESVAADGPPTSNSKMDAAKAHEIQIEKRYSDSTIVDKSAPIVPSLPDNPSNEHINRLGEETLSRLSREEKFGKGLSAVASGQVLAKSDDTTLLQRPSEGAQRIISVSGEVINLFSDKSHHPVAWHPTQGLAFSAMPQTKAGETNTKPPYQPSYQVGHSTSLVKNQTSLPKMDSLDTLINPALNDLETLQEKGVLATTGDAEMRSIAASPDAGKTAESVVLSRTLPPELRQAEVARHIALQISHAAANGAETAIDLQLNPEELGQLKFRMSFTENGIAVIIQADRSETHDLLKRHIDQLHAQFASMGFGEADISFSEQPQDSMDRDQLADAEEQVIDDTEINSSEIDGMNQHIHLGVDIRI